MNFSARLLLFLGNVWCEIRFWYCVWLGWKKTEEMEWNMNYNIIRCLKFHSYNPWQEFKLPPLRGSTPFHIIFFATQILYRNFFFSCLPSASYYFLWFSVIPLQYCIHSHSPQLITKHEKTKLDTSIFCHGVIICRCNAYCNHLKSYHSSRHVI